MLRSDDCVCNRYYLQLLAVTSATSALSKLDAKDARRPIAGAGVRFGLVWYWFWQFSPLLARMFASLLFRTQIFLANHLMAASTLKFYDETQWLCYYLKIYLFSIHYFNCN